jgi:flagellar basal-body rod modification protein FlgD
LKEYAMDVQTPTAVSSTPGTAGVQPQGRADSATALSSDFETFLLMLTTQMENQDPLNPIES